MHALNTLLPLGLLAALHAISLALVLLVARWRDVPLRWMAGAILSIGLYLLGSCLPFSGAHEEYPHLIRLGEPFLILSATFLSLYCIKATRKPLSLEWLLFLPFALYLLGQLPFVLQPPIEKTNYVLLSNSGFTAFTVAGAAFIRVALAGAICLFGMWWCNDHEERLKHWYTLLQHVNLSWLKKGLMAMLALSVLVFAIFLAAALGAWPLPNGELFAALLFTILISAMGYLGFRQAGLFAANGYLEQVPLESLLASNKEETLTPRNLEMAIAKDNTIYIPDLTLSKMASRLDISPQTLTQTFSKEYGQHFYDFVNYQRVTAVRKLVLASEGEINLKRVAEDHGFSDSADLEHFFKKFIGVSVQEFIQQHG